jgi:undecaprenyl-diphosphatase
MSLSLNITNEYSARAKSRITVMTVITICLVAALAVVAIKLARDVQEHETQGVDRHILLAIHQHATPVLDWIVVHTTNIGSPLVVAIIAFGLALYLAYRRDVVRFLVLGGSLVGAAGLAFIIKSTIERPRPQLWHRLMSESGFSFISGHATMSMALAAAIMAILWRTKWRWLAIICGIFYAGWVGFSRLYLGVHYPTDVLGGWVVATAWVMVVSLTIRLVFGDTIRIPFTKKS